MTPKNCRETGVLEVIANSPLGENECPEDTHAEQWETQTLFPGPFLRDLMCWNEFGKEKNIINIKNVYFSKQT